MKETRKKTRKKTKTCANCNSCKSIYERFGCSYYRNTKLCCCAISGKITERDKGCSKWSKRVIGYDLSESRLSAVEEDVKILISYLKDVE